MLCEILIQERQTPIEGNTYRSDLPSRQSATSRPSLRVAERRPSALLFQTVMHRQEAGNQFEEILAPITS